MRRCDSSLNRLVEGSDFGLCAAQREGWEALPQPGTWMVNYTTIFLRCLCAKSSKCHVPMGRVKYYILSVKRNANRGEIPRSTAYFILNWSVAMIIEWNQHIFSADSVRYPFHAKAAYTPPADHLSTDPLGDYRRHMAQMAIERAVLVHPEPYGDDHRLVLACLQQYPDRFKGTALFYPHDPAASAKLRDLVAREPRIVAIRFHAHRGKEQYLDSFDDAGVVALWQTAAELGLIVELHIGPNYARQAAARIADYPTTPVLIDHLAEPHMGNAVEFADVLDLAGFEHVYMKLSGLSHFAGDAPHYTSARPFTRRVIAAFGPTRLVWGAGTPEIVDGHMPEFSEADRALVKGGNLARLLKWE
jgi:L-fuconolactonase